LRVGARSNIGAIDIPGPGMTEKDDVRDGGAYRMWRLRSSDPYVFPTEIPVCVKDTCDSTVLGSVTKPGSTESDVFDPIVVGWKD
jgi:hypothetical protein